MLQLKTKNVRNFITQNVTKLKNSKQDKTKKNLNLTNLKKSNCDKNQKKSNCDKTYQSKL